MLVRNGHKEYNVLNVYSWDKVWTYYAICIQVERDKIRDSAVALRVAFGADASDFEKFLDTLSEKEDCKQALSKPEQVQSFVEKLNGR